MKLIKEFPTLYALGSTGKVKEWTISVFEQDGICLVEMKYGNTGETIKTDSRKVTAGKNIGKANETTVEQQALSEAESKWNKKKDSNYAETIPSGDVRSNLLPMLAHKYSERSHDIRYPAFGQPKLDGVRCLAKKVSDWEIQYTSRKGKPYTNLEHLTPYLLEMMKVDEIFDGEIFTTELTFQEISSAVKRKGHPNSSKLHYWVYDIADTTKTFEARSSTLLKAVGVQETPIRYVPTIRLKDEEAMKAIHQVFRSQKFEGTMVRNADGMYRFDYRSADLQKVKDFDDAEFKIIGGKEGTGKDEGTVVFQCITETGVVFDVRPEGSHEDRAAYLANLQGLIGKFLSVRFQGFTDDGAPRFPVGVTIRDYE